MEIMFFSHKLSLSLSLEGWPRKDWTGSQQNFTSDETWSKLNFGGNADQNEEPAIFKRILSSLGDDPLCNTLNSEIYRSRVEVYSLASHTLSNGHKWCARPYMCLSVLQSHSLNVLSFTSNPHELFLLHCSDLLIHPKHHHLCLGNCYSCVS